MFCDVDFIGWLTKKKFKKPTTKQKKNG